MHNYTPRKFPRTMTEAFGPYADTQYVTPRQSEGRAESPVWWLAGVALTSALFSLCCALA